MRKINSTLLWVIIMHIGVFLFSCVDDKGNYDYAEFEEIIEISGLKEYYSIEPGDTLKITPRPVLASENDKQDDYTYTWYGYLLPHIGSNVGQERYFISEGQKLEMPIVGKWAVPTSTGGEYTIVLEVKNKISGVAVYQSFELNVSISTKAGYIALCEKADNTFDVDILAELNPTKDQYELHTNVFGRMQLEGVDLTATPYGVVAVPDFYSPSLASTVKYGFYLFTDKYSIRLDPNDYTYKEEYNVKNMVEPWSALKGQDLVVEKAVARSRGTTNANTNKYWIATGNNTKIHMLINDNWYFYNTTSNWYYLDEPVNRYIDVNNEDKIVKYKPSKFIACGGRVDIATSYGALFFNEDDNKFMYQKYQWATQSVIKFTTELRDTVAQKRMLFKDQADPNTKLEFMDDGFAIMTGSTGEYRLILFNIPANGNGPTLNESFQRAYLPTTITNVTHWLKKGDNLFCVTGDNKIHSLSLKGLPSEKDANTPVTPVGKADGWWSTRYWDVTSELITDSYSTISCFKCVDNVRYSNTVQSNKNRIGQTQDRINGTVVLGTYNPAGKAGENGKMALFEYNSTEQKLEPKLIEVPDPTEDDPDNMKIESSWIGIGKMIDVTYKMK